MKRYVCGVFLCFLSIIVMSCSDILLDEEHHAITKKSDQFNQQNVSVLASNLSESFKNDLTRSGVPLFPDYYGGSYIDKNGELVILICGDTAIYRNNLTLRMASNNFRTKECAYSYAYLRNTIDTLNKLILDKRNEAIVKKIGVEGVTLLDKENRIEIRIKNCNPDKIPLFKSHIMDNSVLLFKNSEGKASLDSDLRLGAGINNGKSYGSIGYRARSNSGKSGFVTSGHGFVSTGMPVYEGVMAYGNIIGSVNQTQNMGDLDAAFVEVTNSSYYVMNITNWGSETLTAAFDYFTEGIYVCKEGAGANQVVGGYITSTYSSGYFPNAELGYDVYLTGLVSATYPAIGGDSGSPVYNRDGTKYILGIHTGRYQGLSYYVPATRINSRYGLTVY